MSTENESLRWPTNLDRAAILERLTQLRDHASSEGHAEFAARFRDVELMSGGQIGAAVIGALTSIQDKPELQSFAKRLEMVAVNLKNLK